jgi:hypothetical protein
MRAGEESGRKRGPRAQRDDGWFVFFFAFFCGKDFGPHFPEQPGRPLYLEIFGVLFCGKYVVSRL